MADVPCCVQPVSLGTDGSPRLTYSWSSNQQANGFQHNRRTVYNVCILRALSIFFVAQSVIACTSAWSAVVCYPRLKLSIFLVLCSYTLAPVPLFYFGLVPLFTVSCLLCQSLLSGNVTVITLFNIYYGIILAAPMWKLCSFFSPKDWGRSSHGLF